jgi:DNA polymerase-3 subunit gamma/tau
MRDALSIMDQAIASAPVVTTANGVEEPHLDAEQILELMGNVPNTVFERLMEAISENQSAAVIEEINRLLNAGNSPAQLARQFVRYLRNCLMARLGGESTELLQISPDERARAARSALLFSEEDLTRFLDVMLRTFDQLNYRQEQRFHLELGLLKLVHLQRLLPVEQFLSQLPVSSRGPVGGGALPGGGSGRQASPRVSSASITAPPIDSATAATSPPKPAAAAVPFSPFERDRTRKTEDPASASEPALAVVPTHSEKPALRTLTPLEASSQSTLSHIAVLPELDPSSRDAPAQDSAVASDNDRNAQESDAPNLAGLRDAVCDALETAGHHTAAALLSSGNWIEAEEAVRVEVGIKKTMLGLTMNAEAEKIVKTAAREAGFTRPVAVFSVAGGSSENGSAPAKRPAAAGSVQAQALANPLVKQALELFNGEVRSVLDLREKRNA